MTGSSSEAASEFTATLLLTSNGQVFTLFEGELRKASAYTMPGFLKIRLPKSFRECSGDQKMQLLDQAVMAEHGEPLGLDQNREGVEIELSETLGDRKFPLKRIPVFR